MRLISASAVQMRVGRDRAESVDVVGAVRLLLELPCRRLDYAKAKVALDALIEPDLDQGSVFRQLDTLTANAIALTQGDRRPSVRLGAVRRVIYEAGPWNDHRPFSYDLSDPNGQLLRNKLLHNYLATRLGQCISMPILFLIIADRLGLDVALSLAPHHVFIRYTDEQGRPHNIETSNGAHPARDQWLREIHRITDKSIDSGIYLRALPKREAIALMATTFVEHLYGQARFEDVCEVCEVILNRYPTQVTALLWLGSASGHLLDQFRQRFPVPGTAPPNESLSAIQLMNRNKRCFDLAESLGWLRS
jgi:regulator of sirC expression with transglutaminase-like and TPR domain